MLIRCLYDYSMLIRKIIKQGSEVKGTYEFTGEKIDFMLAETNTIKDMFSISNEFENEFVEAICKFQKKKLGPYITEKYFNIIPGLQAAADQLLDDCIETRRAVVEFPKDHCFQSVQFLVRENTINVVCFMRSCDAIKNLPHDAWLCYKMADLFAYFIHNRTNLMKDRPYKCHKVTMMFGSLHVFKDDDVVIKDVF